MAALAGCGNSDPETSVEAASASDQKLADAIQEELKVYDRSFDLESIPQAQRDQLAPIVDNLPQAAGGVRTLKVTDGVVEAVTDFPDDEEGAATGRLICGAIVRAGADSGQDRVLGSGDAVLAECKPDDANFP